MEKTNAKLEKVREMQENLTTVPTETREEVRKLKRSIVEFVQQSESQVKDRSARSARALVRGVNFETWQATKVLHCPVCCVWLAGFAAVQRPYLKQYGASMSSVPCFREACSMSCSHDSGAVAAFRTMRMMKMMRWKSACL